MRFPFAKSLFGRPINRSRALVNRDNDPWFPPLRQPGAFGVAGGLEAGSLARPMGQWPYGAAGYNRNPFLFSRIVSHRARYAVENDPLCTNGASELVSGMIGAGMNPEPASIDDDATKAAVVKSFREWCDGADADGRTDFWGLQNVAGSEIVVTGEALLHLLTGPDGALQIRVIPADRLDPADTRELPDGSRVIAGVQFDADGRRTGYHIRKDDLTFDTVFVPAADMLHVFKNRFAAQVRGISWFAPVLLTANELAQLEDAMLVGAKVSAMLMGFLVDLNATGPDPLADPNLGTQRDSIYSGGLEPGTIKRLGFGQDIKFSSPQQVSTSIDLAKLNIRQIAAGLGCPEFLVSGDLSQANYSSLRAGLVTFKRRLEQYQFQMLVPQMMNPIYRRWMLLEYLAGRLDLPGFEANPKAYLSANWAADPLDFVDPEKDVTAEIFAIGAGLKSRRQSISERGGSIEETDAEIAADNARAKALGLNFVTAVPQPPTPTGV